MNPLKQLEACGQSPWLDYVRRSLIREGRAEDADRARRPEGRHLEPVDLREGDRRSRTNTPTTCRPSRRKGDDSPAAIYEHLAIGDIREARRRAAPGLRRDQGPRRLYQPGVLALSRQRHRGDDRRGAAAVASGASGRNLMVKVPGDAGRRPGDPHADRRGHQHQRHLAVRALPPTSRWPRRTSPASKTLAKPRRRPVARRQRRELLRQPHRHAGRQADRRRDRKAGGDKAALDALRGKVAIANAKLAYAALQGVVRRRALGGAGGEGRAHAAPALGLAPAPRTRATRTRSTSTR